MNEVTVLLQPWPGAQMSRAFSPEVDQSLPTQQAYTGQASPGWGSTSLFWLPAVFIIFPHLQQLPADKSVDACLCLGNHQSKEQNGIQIGRKCCVKSWKQAVFHSYKKLDIKIAHRNCITQGKVCVEFFFFFNASGRGRFMNNALYWGRTDKNTKCKLNKNKTKEKTMSFNKEPGRKTGLPMPIGTTKFKVTSKRFL